MRYVFSFLFLQLSFIAIAQVADDDPLALAIEDVELFSQKFYNPGTDAVIHAMSSGWFNRAKVKEKWKVDFSIVGNLTFAQSNKRSFVFDEADYNSTRLVSGESRQNVASILGENNPDIEVIVAIENPSGGDDIDIQLKLPNGISRTINFIPTAFFQASVGLGHGFEAKARYLPKLNYEDIDAQFFGFALQNELTKWIKFREDFPFHISALVGFTNFDGFYGFTESDKIDDLDGRINAKVNSWLFSGIMSTKYPKLNFYGSLGYVLGHSQIITSTTGVYAIERDSGTIEADINVLPYSVDTSLSAFRLNLGANYKLGEFLVFSDFSLQDFNTLSIGVTYNIY